MTYKDRPYQIDAVNSAIAYLKEGNDCGIIVSATGTGKSIIIARLIQRLAAANPDIRAICATHVSELVEQNSKKLMAIDPNLDIGVYSAGLGVRQADNRIIFGGIQSMYRADLGKFGILIIDECHTISRKDHSMWASLISKLKEKNPRLKIIGLSATDFRLDSGSLTSGEDALFKDVIFEYGLGRAVQDGWLCPLTTKGTSVKYDLSKVRNLAGEYNLKDLEAATNTEELNMAAVQEIIIRGSDRKSWLIFCNGIAHSFAVRDILLRLGISCETVTGETPDYERQRILEEFKAGKIRAVTNNAVWTTGVDVPNVDLIAMMRHTMSGGLLLQMAGRGTRAMVDLSQYESPKDRKAAISASIKPNCLFLDFAGNILKHGFLDQIKAKDKKKKGEGDAPIKVCPECATYVHASARKCHDCGYEFPKNEETKLDSSYGGEVLSGGVEKRIVRHVEYYAHNANKEGKTPSLRVKYLHPDGSSTSEWVCIQHTGFAKSKALKWWKDREGCTIFDDTKVADIIDTKAYESLKCPTSIDVGKQGKYDRVVKYYWDEPQNIGFDKTLDDIEDILF